MRQISRDQLITTLRFHIAQLRPAVRKMLDSHDAQTRARGAEIIAALLADKALHRFEIMTDAPLPPGEQEGYQV
uniref:hypothetical protein n=1 Tax=Halalkalibacter lacteus TaxID=3090663 RepID=UPI002FC94B69